MAAAHASIVNDVAIVGGGLAGTLAAVLLGRAGNRITLIDRHETYPADFRAEHIDGVQIGQLARLGLLEDLVRGLQRIPTVTLARKGRVIGTAPSENYGVRYETLVHRARTLLPHAVQFIKARVVSISTDDVEQRVVLADGQVIKARLLVIATGSGLAICQRAGVKRRLVRHAHSLTFGFDIEPVGRDSFHHPFLVYQREILREQLDYFSAFTLGGRTRVNLFTYRDHRAPSTLSLRDDPAAALATMMPSLTRVTGAYRVIGPVQMRPVDLYASEDHVRPGVVLIGDAFQTACPAAGLGIARLLSDVEQLCHVHVPQWLATPGMGEAKIARYYADPAKQAFDAKAAHDSEYRRLLCTEMTPRWHLHRARIQAQETAWGWTQHIKHLKVRPRLGGVALPMPMPLGDAGLTLSPEI